MKNKLIHNSKGTGARDRDKERREMFKQTERAREDVSSHRQDGKQKDKRKQTKSPPPPSKKKKRKIEKENEIQRENETPKQREWQRKIGIERLAETNTKLNYSTRRTKRQNKKIMERR